MRRDGVWKTRFPIFRNRIILQRGLETAKHTGAACEIRFSAQANPADDQGISASREAKIAQLICPSGKSAGCQMTRCQFLTD
jgi:hypothetical protein